MTITQLRYFIVAAQMENLSNAAAALYISQSSLSKNIASLENELGVLLFDRKGKSLRLNAVGEQFLLSCQRITGEFDEVVSTLRQMDGSQNVKIRIGVEGEIGPLVSWMADFQNMHPEVSFVIDSTLGNNDHPDINEFDIMIYPESKKYGKYKGYPYFTDEYCLAVPRNGEDFGLKGPVSNRELSGKSMVFLRYGELEYEYPREVCRSLMIEGTAEHFVDSEILKRKMIAEGIAVGFVSSENRVFYESDRQIQLQSLLSSRFSRDIMICFKREKHLSDLAREFCEYVKSCLSIEETE